MEYRVITKAMKLYAYQSLFFTTLEYDDLQPIFEGDTRPLSSLQSDEQVLLLTGIASPEQIIHDLTPYTKNLTPLSFSDHHQFKKKDIQLINETFEKLPQPRCIITTEKDATRLEGLEGLSDEVKTSIYSLPITIKFLQEQQESFNNYIKDYVRKNSRNSILVERKDDNKPQDSNYSGNRSRTISFRDN
jgi:tetraacyldisaccharide 4'-kinase